MCSFCLLIVVSLSWVLFVIDAFLEGGGGSESVSFVGVDGRRVWFRVSATLGSRVSCALFGYDGDGFFG